MATVYHVPVAFGSVTLTMIVVIRYSSIVMCSVMIQLAILGAVLTVTNQQEDSDEEEQYTTIQQQYRQAAYTTRISFEKQSCGHLTSRRMKRRLLIANVSVLQRSWA